AAEPDRVPAAGAVGSPGGWQDDAPVGPALRVTAGDPQSGSYAAWRLSSRISPSASRRLANSSSRVRSWQLTPGTSSIHPIHQSPSRRRIAVYVLVMEQHYWPPAAARRCERKVLRAGR